MRFKVVDHRNRHCDIVHMQQSLEVLTTALRVLTALSEKRQPDPADLQELEAFIGPNPPTSGGMNGYAMRFRAR
jgi:hypothetical protein